MSNQKQKLKYVPFVVDEKPFVCWDWNLRQKNIDFLEGIDAEFYKYIAETHGNNLNNDNKQKAALAIRISYYQAMEVLFALLCSMVQAPACVLGWMLSYTNSDLRTVVKKIKNNEDIYSRWNLKNITWHKLSDLVHSFISPENKKEWVAKRFGDFWLRLLSDFLDIKNIQEYNSAKHGLRASPGGFIFSVGVEKEPGKPAPPEKMEKIGGSEFGTSFYYRDHIFRNNKVNFSPKNQHLNWNPTYLANALYLISMSINNVISALRIINKVEPGKCKFLTPDKEESLELFWKQSRDIMSFNYNVNINVKIVHPITKEKIISSYDDNKTIN